MLSLLTHTGTILSTSINDGSFHVFQSWELYTSCDKQPSEEILEPSHEYLLPAMGYYCMHSSVEDPLLRLRWRWHCAVTNLRDGYDLC